MSEEGRGKIYHSKSRTFLAFCFCFILGVAIFSLEFFGANWQFYLFVAGFVALFFIIIFWHNRFKRFIAIGCLFFILGGLRFYLSVPANSTNNLSYYNGKQLSFIAQISSEVALNSHGTQAVASVQSINGQPVSGKVLLFLPPYADLKYGDTVKLFCKLEKPQGKKDFLSYDKYLARDGIWSICNWPKVDRIQVAPNFLSKIVNGFFNFKQTVQRQANDLWPDPESVLMAGLLYGARSEFSAETTNDFSRAGITHIIAISGYNISVVVAVLMNCLLTVGINRRHAFYIAVSGIILFVLFTGASASVVRAGIMGILVLLSTQWGRLSQIGNVLVFTAALMLLFNPFVLIWDVGFQLSFLSTLGLVYISPVLNNFCVQGKDSEFIKSLKENFLTTLSAIIATLPLILFQFGRLSLVAPIANLLILWIIPYLMLLGFIALIFSFFVFPLGQIFAWTAYFGLHYVLSMAHWLASWPMASIDLSVPLWLMIIMYLLIIYLCRQKLKF